MTKIIIDIPEELHNKVKDYAKETHRTQKGVFIMAIEGLLDNENKS